jgi:hypothetical protein
MELLQQLPNFQACGEDQVIAKGQACDSFIYMKGGRSVIPGGGSHQYIVLV